MARTVLRAALTALRPALTAAALTAALKRRAVPMVVSVGALSVRRCGRVSESVGAAAGGCGVGAVARRCGRVSECVGNALPSPPVCPYAAKSFVIMARPSVVSLASSMSAAALPVTVSTRVKLNRAAGRFARAMSSTVNLVIALATLYGSRSIVSV
jgi:hypothetical protein